MIIYNDCEKKHLNVLTVIVLIAFARDVCTCYVLFISKIIIFLNKKLFFVSLEKMYLRCIKTNIDINEDSRQAIVKYIEDLSLGKIAQCTGNTLDSSDFNHKRISNGVRLGFSKHILLEHKGLV